ncbi:MAG: hypothetical protein K2X03_27580 [Bryobacteraceae bacterium]|nr:hypothetical protein [Bryobacteraceae bacterium]
MRVSSLLCCATLCVGFLAAQPVDPAKAPQGLPARATPADYQAQGKVGNFSIGAEFTGHGIPNAQQPLNSEDYVGVEIGLFGPAGAHLTIGASDFSLRINGKKELLPSQPWGMVAKGVKDLEWVSPDAVPGEPKSKGSINGSGGQGSTPPPTPKVPIDTLRAWQMAVRNAALAQGDRALPQAGLVFFPYRGKVANIKSIELIYEGAAGTATIGLQ